MSTATAAIEGDGIESGRSQPQINVGVLGATGTVGQRFITLLSNHPWFVLHRLGASPRSAGKKYREAVNWKQANAIPSSVREMMVYECKPEHFSECAIVFSGLDADAAGDIGEQFVRFHWRIQLNG
jgi:aspartate-semialdehyde dehydrogenase